MGYVGKYLRAGLGTTVKLLFCDLIVMSSNLEISSPLAKARLGISTLPEPHIVGASCTRLPLYVGKYFGGYNITLKIKRSIIMYLSLLVKHKRLFC